MPYIAKEDVYHIRKCFEYLEPVDGVVQMNNMSTHRFKAPAYMGEIMNKLEQSQDAVTFDVFYKIMKPKIIEMKTLPAGSVVLENTSTSVSCLICPYSKNSRRNLNN